jgi:hypothetical protein
MPHLSSTWILEPRSEWLKNLFHVISGVDPDTWSVTKVKLRATIDGQADHLLCDDERFAC